MGFSARIFLVLSLCAILLAAAARNASCTAVPIFTAQYYLANPKQWIGKQVTLSVAHIEVPEKERPDGLRELHAHTYNQGSSGGHIWIVARPEITARLITQCGTHLQGVGISTKTTLIQGIFSQEETRPDRYYFLVEKL